MKISRYSCFCFTRATNHPFFSEELDFITVQIAVEYGIRSIPTLILFKNGVKLETMIGAVPKATLEAKLSQNL